MKKHMPDTLDYVITDMLETITLFNNKVKDATVTETEDGKYKVEFMVEAEKYRVISPEKGDATVIEGDEAKVSISFGNREDKDEKKYIDMNDWIDLAIFAKDEDGNEQEIMLKKVHITGKENKFSFTVDKKPFSVGIDPYHKLIDRKTSDNIKEVKQS
jgi:ABC-2 type transport system permease protein